MNKGKGAFAKLRGVPDRVLNFALMNHAQVLQGMVRFVEHHQRRERLLWVWRLVVTGALIDLLLQGVR